MTHILYTTIHEQFHTGYKGGIARGEEENGSGGLAGMAGTHRMRISPAIALKGMSENAITIFRF